jgi:putative MATE family efflux protein
MRFRPHRLAFACRLSRWSSLLQICSASAARRFAPLRAEKDTQKAERIIGNSFVMLVACSVLVTVFALIFKRPILFLFGASDMTYAYAADYMTIYILGTVFVMISLGLNQYINAQGFARVGMVTIALGAGVNIVLDPVFIFGLNMGVKGAALATIISQFLSALWVILFLTGKRAILKLKPAAMRMDWRLSGKIISMGFTGFVMQGTNSLVLILYNATIKVYGGDLYIGIMTVIQTVNEILRMPIYGMNYGAHPVVGYNYGAKEYGRVRSCIRVVSLISFSYTTLAWAALLIFPAFFIGLFNSDAAVIAGGILPFRLYYAAFIVMFLHYSGQSMFLGLGKARPAIIFSLMRKVLFVMPLIVLLPRTPLGLNGIFLAEPISEVFTGSACYLTMRILTNRELVE